MTLQVQEIYDVSNRTERNRRTPVSLSYTMQNYQINNLRSKNKILSRLNSRMHVISF